MSPFFFYTLLAILIQALFALFEMASVSFNKVRLQYYAALGQRRALWLNFLLNKPSRLFGTTLIGINAALQIGSECSRRFYESIHLDPDWAPLTQVLLVVIFAELAPLFAARRHPEQVAMFLVPFMILIAKLFTPIIWTFDQLSRLIHQIMGKSKEIPLFPSREEIRMAFEKKDGDDLNESLQGIFQLKNLFSKELMTPISRVEAASSLATVGEIRLNLSPVFTSYIPIYHRVRSNIVAIAQIRDLLKLEDSRRVLEHAGSPWFVAEESSVLQILEQFRKNNQSVAVILDRSGQAIGLLSLDDILNEIFREKRGDFEADEAPLMHIERTLSGEMQVVDFNREFYAKLPHKEEETLSDLIVRTLEHPPVKGESIRIGPFLFTVTETTLKGAKFLTVHTLDLLHN